MMQYFETGDIVRFKDNSKGIGLYEVVGINPVKNDYRFYDLTNDECYSEILVRFDEVKLVCLKKYRKDLK